MEVGNHGWMRSLLNNLKSPLIIAIKTAIVNQLGHMIFRFMADFFFFFALQPHHLAYCDVIMFPESYWVTLIVNHFDMETHSTLYVKASQN